MKIIKIIAIVSILLFLNSCASFLYKNGKKNYKLKSKIEQKNLNKYQYDFIYLSKLFEKGFPNIDSLFPKIEREKQKKLTIENLSKENINDDDFILNARKYLSNVNNQHTNIYLNTKVGKRYPFLVFISNNKWFLLNINNEQDSLLIGKEITKINGVNVNEVEKQLIKYTCAENKISQQYSIRIWGYYNKLRYLKAINVIKKQTDKLKITFADSSSSIIQSVNSFKEVNWFKTPIKLNPITKYQKNIYSYKLYPKQNFGYLKYQSCHDKIDILDAISDYVKPWLQPVAKAFVKKQLKKKKPSKHIKSFYNYEYPVFKDFLWELTDSLNDKHINNLIIDLRNNPGGNLTLGIQLIYFLTNKTNLKGFSEYAYTSDIYKMYFTETYKKLEKKYSNAVPKNKILLTNENEDLFKDITDTNSIYHIPKNRPVFKGKVYILSNYSSNSAASMLTTLFQDNNIATTIGTSVSNNPTSATVYVPFKLPKTKSNVSISAICFERPDTSKGKVQIPNYWIEYSVNDIFTGNDPYLEKALELINNKGK